MQTFCNRHAQAANLGENLSAQRFVYWMAAHFSSQVQSLKKDMPTASREDIRFRILDRWGLPIVPWVANVLGASLCKGPDHGIAMKLGIIEPTGFDSFDPVRHIDLALCTVTIDTIGTNFAMKNYYASSWPDIRRALGTVPLRHPLWRIDESAGKETWNAESDSTIAPVMPIPDFDVPLIPIDAWFTGSQLTPRCERCNLDFPSLGTLVQHCRDTHSSGAARTRATPANPEQDAIDAEYWQNQLTCSSPGCGKTFVRRHDRERHMRSHLDDRPFACQWTGCDYAAIDAASLTKHMRIHVPDDRYACTHSGCTHVATSAPLLAAHMTTHTGDKPFVCDVPGCNKKYASRAGLSTHKASHTGKANYPCDICGEPSTQLGNLRRHKNRKHPGWDKKDAA